MYFSKPRQHLNLKNWLMHQGKLFPALTTVHTVTNSIHRIVMFHKLAGRVGLPVLAPSDGLIRYYWGQFLWTWRVDFPIFDRLRRVDCVVSYQLFDVCNIATIFQSILIPTVPARRWCRSRARPWSGRWPRRDSAGSASTWRAVEVINYLI